MVDYRQFPMIMTGEKIKQMLGSLPHLPGVYRYFNKEGVLIYVGKAKNLRKRVASYFNKKPESRKARNLVENIHHLEFTIVDTEQDALLLENSLIKHYQPRYNINLKDDKTYPYIVIKNEPFPRVFITRDIIKDGSEYFGPYTSVGKIRELLELIRTLIPIRANNHDLFIRVTENGKLKVYPEYYMTDATGKDEEMLTAEDYEKGIQQVREIFKGKLAPVIKFLQDQIKESVRKMEFEKAEILQNKLEFMQEYKASSVVVNSKVGDLDVFTIRVKETQALVNYLQVRKGAIVQTKTVVFKRNPDTSQEEMLISAIVQLQKKTKSHVRELIVPFPIEYPNATLTITIPQKGIKKKLLELSRKNLIYFSDKIHNKKGLKAERKDD